VWPNNAGRHSYGSYHLAAYEDAGKTAFQMGHKGVDVLYRDYNKVVTLKSAKTFWSISPTTSEKITNIKSA
jgi:hypothetical protein